MPPDQDHIDRAIDRAIASVKDLMRAELRAIAVQLSALNEKFERVDRIEARVEGLDSRLTAVEAFKSQHEHRIVEMEKVGPEGLDRRIGAIEARKDDLRTWLWNHAPSLVLGAGGLVYALLH